MQHSDDRPPAPSSRPSLLSAEQQGEADRQRILSGLDNKPALTTAGAQKARSSALKWVAAGAAVLALTAGAGVWLVSEGEKEIVLAGTAPLPATPAPSVPLASEPAGPVAPAEEVSTAAILEDMPVMADKGAAAPAPAPAARPADEIKSLLEKGLPAAAPRAGGKPLVMADAPPYAGAAPAKAAPVKPAPAKAAPAKAAPAKPAAKKTTAKADPKARAKAAPPVKKKPATAKVDSDEALLAALMAHSKATQPKRPSAAAVKLRQCKALGSVADAEQCRAQLCAGSAKNEAECKAPRAVKAAG